MFFSDLLLMWLEAAALPASPPLPSSLNSPLASNISCRNLSGLNPLMNGCVYMSCSSCLGLGTSPAWAPTRLASSVITAPCPGSSHLPAHFPRRLSKLAGLRQDGPEAGTGAGRPSILADENMVGGSSPVATSSSLGDGSSLGFLVDTVDPPPPPPPIASSISGSESLILASLGLFIALGCFCSLFGVVFPFFGIDRWRRRS